MTTRVTAKSAIQAANSLTPAVVVENLLRRSWVRRLSYPDAGHDRIAVNVKPCHSITLLLHGSPLLSCSHNCPGWAMARTQAQEVGIRARSDTQGSLRLPASRYKRAQGVNLDRCLPSPNPWPAFHASGVGHTAHGCL